jgi:1,2-diacylglycerol 3-alpha-glucosyltransferase
MHLLIFTANISPYHRARYEAAHRSFEKVTVLVSHNEGDFEQFIAAGADSYDVLRLFEGKETYIKAVANGTLIKKVTTAIEELAPNVIAVAGWYSPESIVALKMARKHGIPSVVMSESQADDASRSYIREVIKGRIVSQFDAALVGGPSHAAYVNRLGIPSERIHFGYNAVDNEYFASGSDLARSNPETTRRQHLLPDRYVLASARFIKKKNIPNLVYAYAQARKQVDIAPDLVILGDGPEIDAIKFAITQGNVKKNVHLCGFQTYESLPEIYGLAEGFVHVSTVEQWGLVINEAMAAGIPVIASNCCGAARTVITDGVSGILTEPVIPSITGALVKLFSLPPDQRALMGLAASDAIAAWGPTRFASGMRKAVESALAARKRGPVAPWDRAIMSSLERKLNNVVH